MLLSVASVAALVTSPARADHPCSGIDKHDCPQPMQSESARGLALGTGLRASSLSTSALAYSQAALALGNLYHLEGNVDYLAAYKTAALGAAVVDSSTSKLGAGVALRGFVSGKDGYGGLDGRVGLAFPLSDAFSVGVGGRYMSLIAPDGSRAVRGFTMDASLRLSPIGPLQIDIGALNFIDHNSPYMPVTLVSSVALAALPSLSFGADVLVDMTSFSTPQFTAGGGVEFLAGESIPLRIGYAADIARGSHLLSGGIGYTDQRVGLDLSVRQQIHGGHDTRIMGAVRYYVN